MADTVPGERRRLVRYSLWAAGVLLAAGVVLYAAFWLPYRTPEDATPRALQILPAAGSPAAAADAARLRESGWVDREAGIVRIPVDEAMTILAPNLPAREGGAAAHEERMQRRVPTDAGSGRALR